MDETGVTFPGDLVAAALRAGGDGIELGRLSGCSLVAARQHEIIEVGEETITIQVMGRACPYHVERALKTFDVFVPAERQELLDTLRRFGRFAPARRTSVLRSRLQDELVRRVVRRGVRSLYHFTRASSLSSVLTFGLRCREGNEVAIDWTDPLRLDCRLDSISLSMSFPNEEMLRAIRRREPHEIWCILEFSREVLWQKHCLFFSRNAAAGRFWSQPSNHLEGADAFDELFHPSGRAIDLPGHFPTDVQAEVLVEAYIEPELIKAVHFRNEVESCLGNRTKVNIAVTPQLFGTRAEALQNSFGKSTD